MRGLTQPMDFRYQAPSGRGGILRARLLAPPRSTSWRYTPCTSRGKVIVILRSALILLASLVLMGACTEVALEQPATGTGQAAMQGPQVGDGVQDNCDLPLSTFHMDDISGTSPRVAWHGERYIRWLPDGSRILFNGFVHPIGPSWPAPDLYSVAPNRAHLDKIGSNTIEIRRRISIVLLPILSKCARLGATL